MKLKFMLFTFVVILAILQACQPATTDKEEANTTDNKKDLSGITYYDLLKQVFEDDGFSFTLNTDTLSNDYHQSLTISKAGACGDGGCGELLSLTNSSASDTLEVIVAGTYDLEGNTGQITRQYVIPANGKVSIGCSHLCFDGTPYIFERKIVGSKIFVEQAL